MTFSLEIVFCKLFRYCPHEFQEVALSFRCFVFGGFPIFAEQQNLAVSSSFVTIKKLWQKIESGFFAFEKLPKN
jgi:hypothetical protein